MCSSYGVWFERGQNRQFEWGGGTKGLTKGGTRAPGPPLPPAAYGPDSMYERMEELND